MNRSKQQGGAGFSSIIFISQLQSIIREQVLEVNSMVMTACDLIEKLNCLDDIHQEKLNVYASAEAAMDKQFLDALKAKRSLLYACFVDERHIVETWTGLR